MPMHMAWSSWTLKILLDRESRPTEHCRGMEITHWHPQFCDWHGPDHGWKPPSCTVSYQRCLMMDKGRVNPQGFDKGMRRVGVRVTGFIPLQNPYPWHGFWWVHHMTASWCLLIMINTANPSHCMSVTLLPPYPGKFSSDSFLFYLKIIVFMCRRNVWIDNSLMFDGYGTILEFYE